MKLVLIASLPLTDNYIFIQKSFQQDYEPIDFPNENHDNKNSSLNLPQVNIITMKILGCIGAGSFGKVLKVQIGDSLFAVKKIQLEFDCEDDSFDMQEVKKQAKILSGCLYHPNIVRYYDSFRRGDEFFIAMEYIDGLPLSDAHIPFDGVDLIVRFIAQLLLVLKFLKKKCIIHRDIKPSNILLSRSGLFKLVDFGVSKKVGFSEVAKSCLGTPYYTAPEVFEGKSYDYSVDLWSFGVVLYEICHGKVPFYGKDLEQLKKNIQNSHPKLRNDLQEDIKLIIRGCLMKDPKNRFSISQMMKLPFVQQHLIEYTSAAQKLRIPK